jgi:hypothetical protein
MEPLYYLFGKNGWLSRSSQFNSDIAQALKVPYSEAIDRCRAYKSASQILVPVAVDDMGVINR